MNENLHSQAMNNTVRTVYTTLQHQRGLRLGIA